MITIKDFAKEVQRMRLLQKEYFKGRDRTVMEQSKAQEKKVDGMAAVIMFENQ